MPNFVGKLLQGDKVTAEPISGTYTVRISTGVSSWDGHFSVPDGAYPMVGDGVLQLADGRTARIIITNTSTGSHVGATAHFSGNGPPP